MVRLGPPRDAAAGRRGDGAAAAAVPQSRDKIFASHHRVCDLRVVHGARLPRRPVAAVDLALEARGPRWGWGCGAAAAGGRVAAPTRPGGADRPRDKNHRHWWIGFSTGSHASMRDDLRCYYLLYGARYVAGFISVYFEPRRKDYVEMQLHHVVTVAVVAISCVRRAGLMKCDAAAAPDVDRSRTRVAAAAPDVDSPRGDGSRRRRGRVLDSPWRRGDDERARARARALGCFDRGVGRFIHITRPREQMLSG